jgi:NodT family efflux transporter outer membrane factor (OMF) lipoprotein
MKALLGALLALILHSCQLYTPVPSPDVGLNGTFHALETVAMKEGSRSFFEQFQDETLLACLNQVLLYNQDRKAAIERIFEAESLYGVERSKGLPQVDLGIDAQRTRSSQSGFAEIQGSPFSIGVGQGESVVTNIFLQAFNASWEIDFFAKIRNQKRRAKAFIEEIEAEKRSVDLTLASDAALSYFAIQAYGKLMELEEKKIEALQRIAGCYAILYGKGLDTDTPLTAQSIKVQDAKQLYLGWKTSYQMFLHHLQQLMGQTMQDNQLDCSWSKTIDVQQLFCNISLPAKVLEARPDVMIAASKVVQSGYSVKVAKAALLPSVALLGAFGFADTQFPSWFTYANSFFSIGPTLRWPLFDGFKNYSLLQGAKSKEKQAVYAYRQTVLKALEDVENCLVTFFNQQMKAGLAGSAYTHQSKIARSKKMLYDSGIQPQELVLQELVELIEKEKLKVMEEFKTRQALIALYKAIGGEWK